MTLAAIPYPAIDPVIIEIGPIAIRWYALAYIAGILFAWIYMKRLMRDHALWGGPPPATPEHVDDLLVWGAAGVIVGGRLGYILGYGWGHYLDNPLDALAVWRGGMSFHGGFLGVVIAVLVFCRLKGLAFWPMIDAAAAATPVGLFFGRIANFINGELYGRPSDVPWAVVFPDGGPEPRHPSQIYEALLEGVVLFLILRWLTHRRFALRRPGLVSGVFALGYGSARIMVEFFREPDGHIGFLAGGLTMGMALSLPMVAVGIGLVAWAARRTA